MSNPRKPKTTGAQPVFPNSPYIQPIENPNGLIVGYRAFTNEGAFHVRYDLSAPKSYTPPQMLAHVPSFDCRAEALSCVEEKTFRALFRTFRSQSPTAQRKDVADLLNPIVREAVKNARNLDPGAHAILTDFSFMARNTVFEFLRTTEPNTPERKALTDALTAVPALPVLVPLPALPHARKAILKGASLKEIVKRFTGLTWKTARAIDPWAAGLFILNRRQLQSKDGLLTRNDVAQHVHNAHLTAQRGILRATIAIAHAARDNADQIPHTAIPWAARIAKEAQDRDHNPRQITDWAIAAMLEPDGPAGAWEPNTTLDGAIRRATAWKEAMDAEPVPDLSWSRPNYAPPDDTSGRYTFTFIDNARFLADAAKELGNCAKTYTEDAATGACALYALHMGTKLHGMAEIVPAATTDEHRWMCIQATARFNGPLSRSAQERLRGYAQKYAGVTDDQNRIN